MDCNGDNISIVSVGEVDPLVCPKCSAEMRVIAVIERAGCDQKNLEALGSMGCQAQATACCERSAHWCFSRIWRTAGTPCGWLYRWPALPCRSLFLKILKREDGLAISKTHYFQPILANCGLTLQSSFCIWLFIGKSQLGLGVASAAALYFVTHPQPAHNHVNHDFLLDPLSKNEFLSFLMKKCVNEKRIFYFNFPCCF